MSELKIRAIFFTFLLFVTGYNQSSSIQVEENSLGIRMVKINPGNFTAGSLNDDGFWDEYPAHQVKISQPFFISESEITLEQYRNYKADFTDSSGYLPYAVGMSWHDAVGFCAWLSEKEGKPYRLPTEAEWEYVCRAGTKTTFSSGDDAPEHESANNWGIKNMHTGVLEWCYDWYGPYPHDDQTDPVGYVNGFSKVVRGGLPDDKMLTFDYPFSFYQRSANRASIAPAFSAFSQSGINEGAESIDEAYDQFMPGLTGILFDDAIKKKPLALWQILGLDSDDLSWKDLKDWSAEWNGSIYAPYSGEILFYAEAEEGIELEIAGKMIIAGWGKDKARQGSIELEEGEKYPIVVSYFKDRGNSFMRVYWSWEGQEKVKIPSEAIVFNTNDKIKMKERFYISVAEKIKSASIGFRIVQAPLPETRAWGVHLPFVQQGVRMNAENIQQGPSLEQPYFRKRNLLPAPPENSDKNVINAVAFHPALSRHTHDPGLTICNNGDVFTVLYTSTFEDEPEVSMIALRLRYGSDQWDMPSPFVDFADVNDVAPMLWNENGTLRFYWGNIHLDSMYPFQWMESIDNGATWGPVHFPNFITTVGPNTPQPINSAFRDKDGTIYVACDGLGATSVLYLSEDDGKTWIDTGGRSGGRHTSFVQLRDGSILGMGGKHSHIDGYMPQSVSNDRGKTWILSKTPFASMGTNQRPSIIRLSSGRLFMAGDYQQLSGSQPAEINERGSYVALSDDEGKTWSIKKLPGGQGHELLEYRKNMRGGTLGYSAAKQAPNGIIHLIATMTHPCLHYEFNEAWILSADTYLDFSDDILMSSRTRKISEVKKYLELYADSKDRIQYHAGIADDGRFLNEGLETWYFPDGSKQYEVTYHLGQKTGLESYWNRDGKLIWQRAHQINGLETWTQWWPNGQMKARSHWINKICNGKAQRWDYDGNLISEMNFLNGEPVKYRNY